MNPRITIFFVFSDDGEEVQHLGRTLECTLCGLRGKRCHLTLHFKAKHNEVIDIAGVHGSRKQTNNKQPSKTTQQPQTQPPQVCSDYFSPKNQVMEKKIVKVENYLGQNRMGVTKSF